MMDDSGVLAARAMMMYQTKTERLWLTKNGGLRRWIVRSLSCWLEQAASFNPAR